MALYRTLTPLLLAASAALAGISAASASGAKLKLTCGLPDHGVVSCRLIGTGFQAHEHLRLTYRVEFTALPPVHGKHPTNVYHRDAQTNANGIFVRPTLRFVVVKYHESYRLTATAAGARGDRAAITLVAIAQ